MRNFMQPNTNRSDYRSRQLLQLSLLWSRGLSWSTRHTAYSWLNRMLHICTARVCPLSTAGQWKQWPRHWDQIVSKCNCTNGCLLANNALHFRELSRWVRRHSQPLLKRIKHLYRNNLEYLRRLTVDNVHSRPTSAHNDAKQLLTQTGRDCHMPHPIISCKNQQSWDHTVAFDIIAHGGPRKSLQCFILSCKAQRFWQILFNPKSSPAFIRQAAQNTFLRIIWE